MEFGGQLLLWIKCLRSLRSDPGESAGQIGRGLELEGRARQGLRDTWWPLPHVLPSHLTQSVLNTYFHVKMSGKVIYLRIRLRPRTLQKDSNWFPKRND